MSWNTEAETESSHNWNLKLMYCERADWLNQRKIQVTEGHWADTFQVNEDRQLFSIYEKHLFSVIWFTFVLWEFPMAEQMSYHYWCQNCTGLLLKRTWWEVQCISNASHEVTHTPESTFACSVSCSSAGTGKLLPFSVCGELPVKKHIHRLLNLGRPWHWSHLHYPSNFGNS